MKSRFVNLMKQNYRNVCLMILFYYLFYYNIYLNAANSNNNKNIDQTKYIL